MNENIQDKLDLTQQSLHHELYLTALVTGITVFLTLIYAISHYLYITYIMDLMYISCIMVLCIGYDLCTLAVSWCVAPLNLG